MNNFINSAAALEHYGYNFNPIERPIYDRSGNELSGYKQVVRSDNMQQLSVVKTTTGLQSNNKCFGFIDKYMQSGDIICNNVIGENFGAKTIMRFNFKNEISFDKNEDEKFMKEFLLINSFDNSAPLSIVCLVKRLACSNGLMAIRKSSVFSIKHSVNFDVKYLNFGRYIDSMSKFYDNFIYALQKMNEQRLSDEEALRIIGKFFGTKNTTRSNNIREKVFDLFHNGIGNKGRTAYDLYNAVTEFTDHYRTSNTNKRLISSLTGSSASLKYRVADYLIENAA